MKPARKSTELSRTRQARAEERHFRKQTSLAQSWPRWASWCISLLSLILVVIVSMNWVEEKNIFSLLAKAKPLWILLGLIFQLGTYVAQGLCWRTGLSATGQRVPLLDLARLSVAQVFINQAVPSATVSGTLFVTKALSQKGLPDRSVATTVTVELISFACAYSVALLMGIACLAWSDQISPGTLIATALLLGLAILLLIFGSIRTLQLAPRWVRVNRWIRRSSAIRHVLHAFQEFDRSPPSGKLLAKACIPQLGVFALDALTLWAMIHALGSNASFAPVFAAYMAASFARTIGILPGGLGTFEAVAIASIHQAGLPVANSLAATLLYRALSFWLPMLPGLLIARLEFHPVRRTSARRIEAFWSLPAARAFEQSKSSPQGLSSDEAKLRLVLNGPNKIHAKEPLSFVRMIWNQIKSPLVLLLLVASVLSAITGEWTDSAMVTLILVISVGIGAWREYDAQSALEKLSARLQHTTEVLRDGKTITIPVSDVVPGDIALLSAGSLVPADSLILESTDFYLNESVITGESFPVLKRAIPEGIAKESAPAKRRNSVFLGSHVQTGSGRCLVMNTGPSTLFGAIAEATRAAPPDTEFDRGITNFGYLLLKIMIIIVLIVFTFHVVTTGATVQVLMFSMALAVGLSPELLPLIVNYDLAYGAKLMASQGVLVRHPKAIENLGSMEILCTDKTGTLTEGVVHLEGGFAGNGTPSPIVLREAALNASLQSGLTNPLDEAIRHQTTSDIRSVEKIGEIPYDFVRKRLSVVVRENGTARIITKGALSKILEVCSFDAEGEGLDEQKRAEILERFRVWSQQGARVLGVAAKPIPGDSPIDQTLERGLRFQGFLVFADKPKEGVADTLRSLSRSGVRLKIITGDNTLVSQAIASQVGLPPSPVLEGADLDRISDEALSKAIENVDLFTQVDPNQKERIIQALRKSGRVVGYMGDGINDIAAMHSADASISVESAVDVAKSAADLVLMEKSLEMLRDGILLGRTTFTNSLKYINITMSSNLGNMISMAIASLYLPFLPLSATQILLNNLLSDVPALGLAHDRVDSEQIQAPTRWDLRYILRYMLTFGMISSLFDFLTFGVFLEVFKLDEGGFRTGWFTESLLTEIAVVMVLRTRRSFIRSRPGQLLLYSTFALIAVTLALPYATFASAFGFQPLSPGIMSCIVGITIAYIAVTETAKRGLAQFSEL